jgi:hypothetical protein
VVVKLTSICELVFDLKKTRNVMEYPRYNNSQAVKSVNSHSNLHCKGPIDALAKTFNPQPTTTQKNCKFPT